MRKVIGVIVAVMMCVSMCACFASASSGLDSIFGDSEGEISNLLGGLSDMSILGLITGSEETTAAGENLLDQADVLAANIDEIDFEDSAKGVLNELLGEEAADEAAALLNEENMNVDQALSGLTSDNSGDFMSTITGILDSVGLGDALSGLGIGEFNLGSIIDSILGTSDNADPSAPTDAVASNDFMAGIADTLLGGLQSIGIDTSIIEGLLDNEIVNFFANLYCGWNTGKPDVPDTTLPDIPTDAPTIVTEVPTTQPPIPVKTGDTSSVLVAIGTLSVAAAAAFVCMKKKRA